jgi:DNA (cytosine-5)-methyltransferase 1
MRWLYDLRPEWTAMEEVPDVLPLWQQYAEILRAWGYSVWTGILNAADFGVPQTRRRAILIASRVRTVTAPEPTHAEAADDAMLFGPTRRKWVSMAEALGWGATDRPVPTVTAGGGKTGGAEPFPTQARAALERSRDNGDWALRSNTQANASVRDLDEPAGTLFFGARGNDVSWVLRAGDRERGTVRPVDEPAATLVFGNSGNNGVDWVLRNGNQPRAAVRSVDEPAPTMAFGNNAARIEWVAERPATTVAATDRIAKPGHRDRERGERQFEDSVRITVEEASVLQSFRRDYPWQGTKTKRFEQIGNAVPPRLAAAVIGAATGLDWQSAVESEYAPTRPGRKPGFELAGTHRPEVA